MNLDSEEEEQRRYDAAQIEQDRTNLRHVMTTPSADPVELSLEYIKLCLTDHNLGKGAYGDVFLAEDSHLPKRFAVKKIRPTQCDQETIEGNAQMLSERTVGVRLSVMFQLARAVHFLHTGGCKVAGEGLKVFHRDIKSANVWLVDDFTPRLIDCGLAKFVLDDPGATREPVLFTSGGLAFGTLGYVCPDLLRKWGAGYICPYIAAYDVYSIGVVLVELVLGCLNAMPSTRLRTPSLDVFEKYVQGGRTYQRIVDGWDKLKSDADPTVNWNSGALEIACKAAIQCIDPFPEDRLSTEVLLDTLSDAIVLNTNSGIQHPQAVRGVNSGPLCDICNNYRTEITCSDAGHALCTVCILDKLGDDNGSQLSCLIKECSSELRDLDLYGRMPDKEKERNPHKKPKVETHASVEKSPSSTDVALEKDQKLLLHVMNTPSADPVELSLEFIERCIKKDHKLGSGSFGDVFLAEDSRLPKKFAVKMINPTKHDQDTIEDIRISFQTELSFKSSSTQQCLVYEYAANGSLADFLHHHSKARLSADIRLSIMFELTRAVHFLHTGGCKVLGKGWKVFHRDIKSANICLSDNFTARLIDCGLAKFVRDSNATPGAVTLKSTNRNGTFGTPGYMCPEYSRKKGAGHPCPISQPTMYIPLVLSWLS
ncbi:serine/threonine kinase [Fragilaria crotonensis]|nr:serine/threonine kinase [Fragilaria crotonensis]